MRLIYSKTVDKSILWDGFTIRTSLLNNVLDITGSLGVGQTRDIKLILGNKIYDGIKLCNIKFNRNKYPDHPELYQVRYSQNSEFSQALRLLYPDVWEYISIKRAEYQRANLRKNVAIPENLSRQIAFYTTELENVWQVETFTSQDYTSMREFIQTNQITESYIENQLLNDNNSRISKIEGVKKIRVLDRRVGDSLKKLYSYRCQVCGCEIGPNYSLDKHVIEAHHISPFSKSLNNNFNNILILCPNHHRTIHTFNGEFQSRNHTIVYPNGYREPLKLNLHL